MKTPKEFDYDLWTEEGRNMVRVKCTGEVCEVDADTMRMLRAEEKRLRRSMRGVPAAGSGERETVLSLDYTSADESGEMTPAWLEDPRDFTKDVTTKLLSQKFIATLTEREKETYACCVEQEHTQQEFATASGLSISRVSRLMTAIQKKAKKFF